MVRLRITLNTLNIFVAIFILFAIPMLWTTPCCGQSEPDVLSDFPRVQYEVHVNASNTASILDAVSIVGRVCAEPEAIARAFACSMHIQGTLITFSFPFHTVSSAADASFCAVRHHETDFLEMMQMLNPLIFHEGRIYVPLEEFLRVLHETGVYSVEQDNTLISLQSEQNESPANTETTIIFLAPNDDSPTNQTVTSSTPTTKSQTATKFDKPTRNRYILPEDLKRRGVETPTRLNYVPHSTKSMRLVQVLILSRFFQVQKQSQSEKISASKAKQSSKNKTGEKVAIENDFSSAKRKWALDVIVLDAGHGGKDGGTIGFGKTKEKDVALCIVKKLGTFIKKEMPGTKVVYTRTDDTFVELERRGQIANENGGKLFVSIHCNSTPKKPSKANGFEVYILRPGRNEDAARIAEVENSVIKLEDDPKRYKPLTDEQFIIVSMAQSSFVRYSDMAAAMITAEVKKLKDIGVRGVNQAGFIVLVGASMPNMLIETGFLSNKKEEKFLKSAVGQTKLALAICRAINAYRTRYEEQIRGTVSLKEYDSKKNNDTKIGQTKRILSVKTPTKKSSTIVVSKSSPSTKKK